MSQQLADAPVSLQGRLRNGPLIWALLPSRQTQVTNGQPVYLNLRRLNLFKSKGFADCSPDDDFRSPISHSKLPLSPITAAKAWHKTKTTDTESSMANAYSENQRS